MIDQSDSSKDQQYKEKKSSKCEITGRNISTASLIKKCGHMKYCEYKHLENWIILNKSCPKCKIEITLEDLVEDQHVSNIFRLINDFETQRIHPEGSMTEINKNFEKQIDFRNKGTEDTTTQTSQLFILSSLENNEVSLLGYDYSIGFQPNFIGHFKNLEDLKTIINFSSLFLGVIVLDEQHFDAKFLKDVSDRKLIYLVEVTNTNYPEEIANFNIIDTVYSKGDKYIIRNTVSSKLNTSMSNIIIFPLNDKIKIGWLVSVVVNCYYMEKRNALY